MALTAYQGGVDIFTTEAGSITASPSLFLSTGSRGRGSNPWGSTRVAAIAHMGDALYAIHYVCPGIGKLALTDELTAFTNQTARFRNTQRAFIFAGESYTDILAELEHTSKMDTKDAYMIAAVGLAGPVFSILSGLGTLFGSGGCTVISLALGKGDHARVRKVSALCFYGSILFGVVFAVVVLLFLEPVCRLIGADENTIVYTMNYLRVIMLFAPISIFSNVFLNLIRADGAAKESMIANVLGTAMNIILDPLFILLFHWGVTGAAVATGLGNCTSAAYLLWHIYRNRTLYSVKPSDAKPETDVIFPAVSLGLPMAFSTILMSFSHVLSNNLLVSYDAIALAAQGVAGKIGMLNSMIAMGICMGMQPAISYNYAAQNTARTIDILKRTCLTVVITGTIISLTSFLFRDALIAAFIDDEAVVSIGRVALLASVAVGPVYGIYQMATTYFQSTGRAGHAALCSLLSKGSLYLYAVAGAAKFLRIYYARVKAHLEALDTAPTSAA